MSCPQPYTWRKPYTSAPYGYAFRTCNHCGGIHPEDAIRLIAEGCKVEGTTKGYKRYLHVPNPLAGKVVRSGSMSGSLFSAKKLRWWQRLTAPATALPYNAGAPTIMERLRGRYNRELRGPAPSHTHAKIYFWHFDEGQINEYNRLVTPRSDAA